MNKKLVSIILSLIFVLPTTAHAALKNKTTDNAPSLVIIDTALDTSIPEFKNKILYEVCLIEWSTCPNGQSFMEGPGAASMPLSFIKKNGFDHGTQMVSSALKTNPNMNIIFIRIVGNTPSGLRQKVNEKSLTTAMNWVYNNKTRFNIQALSMSQGTHSLLSSDNYCLNTPDTASIISLLKQDGVASFFPTGNVRDLNKIDWPACIPDSIAVGATVSDSSIAPYSNFDASLTDFFAIGSMKVKVPGNKQINAIGTSVSAQVAAATWVAVKTKNELMSYEDIYNLFISKSINVTGNKVFGKMIKYEVVLNG